VIERHLGRWEVLCEWCGWRREYPFRAAAKRGERGHINGSSHGCRFARRAGLLRGSRGSIPLGSTSLAEDDPSAAAKEP